MNREHGVARVVAAQGGDPQAQDELVAAYLPLVYNIVGRALGGHADVDDVVQETMLRALHGLGTLRIPESFRSWLVAIAMNEVRRHWQREQTAAAPVPAERVPELADPGADFVGLTLVRMGLSGQRRETVEATRWLDGDDRALLSLWWLEAAGELNRAEVATALELSPDHTAVRVQRMKAQLEAARVVVRALAAVPPCEELREVLAPWDGAPSALWRKRITRHAKECAPCSGHRSGLVPAEGLLAGFGLVPVAGVLAELVSRAVRDTAPGPSMGATGSISSTQPQPQPQPQSQPQPQPQPQPQSQAQPPAPHPPEAHLSDTYPEQAMPAEHPSYPHPDPDPHLDPHPHPDSYLYADTVPAEGAGVRTARRRQRTRRRRQVMGAAALLVFVGGGFGVFRIFSGGSDGGASETVAEAGRPDRPVLPGASASRSAVRTPGAVTPTVSVSPTRATPSKTPTPARTSAKPKPPPAPRPTRTPTATRTARPPAPPAPPAGPAQEVVNLLNAERAKAGCGALSSNSLLRTAAQRHSEDMVTRGYFDHTNPDGDGPGERVTATGYRWSTYGENIAAGQSTPAAVMESWMNSAGHRANILNCSFKEVGIGIKDASGGIRWTQVFGAR
ncbi:sigma-70 family RNA polymerase sigma factor [Streptomyces sp. NPDC091272]|uniref:sigma-70 family RNA polymerase sigma factor n=1 Tax=Streptomyces sp. NPDC091272 TaxID=3365981 RepID=UPI00381E7058